MKQLKQIKQLIGAYADNLVAQERVLRQLTRIIDSLLPDKAVTTNQLHNKLKFIMDQMQRYEMSEEERERLRPHFKETDPFPVIPASSECRAIASSQATVSIPVRVCHSGEEYFIPLTEKDSTGKQLGVICNNSWGLMPNTSTCLVSYPSDSIESITKEIHKKG